LIALLVRLSSTWRSRVGSPTSRAGRPVPDTQQQLQALLVGPQPEHVDDVAEHGVELELDPLELHVAGLDLRDVEDVVQDLEQALRRVVRLLDVVALARRQAVLECEVGHADDRVHRRAQLVRHVGEEARLGLAGRLGCLARLLHRDLGLLARGDVLDHAQNRGSPSHSRASRLTSASNVAPSKRRKRHSTVCTRAMLRAGCCCSNSAGAVAAGAAVGLLLGRQLGAPQAAARAADWPAVAPNRRRLAGLQWVTPRRRSKNT
jgi:hypothetical protein